MQVYAPYTPIKKKRLPFWDSLFVVQAYILLKLDIVTFAGPGHNSHSHIHHILVPLI